MDASEKESLVRGVFERVAPSYDVMNDVMSAGVHRLWKDYFVSKVGVFAGVTHLDVAGGTGDIAFRVLRALQRTEREAELDGQVLDEKTRGEGIVSDINPAMLEEGVKRATQRGLKHDQLRWLEGNAEKLPVEDGSVDVYTIAFGLRNVTNTKAAVADAYRCLKPGGKYMILEFSHVENDVLASDGDITIRQQQRVEQRKVLREELVVARRAREARRFFNTGRPARRSAATWAARSWCPCASTPTASTPRASSATSWGARR